MIQVRATSRHARMTPRKIRPLASALRGLPAAAAQQQLMFIPGKAAKIVGQVLASAVANAEHNHSITATSLRIASIYVNEGLKMRRFRAASRGMAHGYVKRTSHVTVVVEGNAPGKAKKKVSDIETVSADVYAAEEGKAEPQTEDVDVTKQEKKESAGASQKQADGGVHKTKMMQQGGEKQKTHRRKSV